MKKDEIMSKNIKYIQREELENLKKKLLAKVLRDFNNKYNSVLNDKEVKAQVFTKDLEKEIGKIFDFNNPDYNKFFQKVEKLILNKLNKIQDKKRGALLNREEVEDIAEGKVNESYPKLIKDDYTQTNNSSTGPNTLKQSELNKAITNKNYTPSRYNGTRILLNEYKKKENDEWALLIKNDHDDYIKNNQLKNYELAQMKHNYLENIQKQIEFKKELEKKRKKEEEETLKKLIQMSNDNLKMEEEFNRNKLAQKREMNLKLFHENEQNKEILRKNEEMVKEEEKRIEEEMKIYSEMEEKKMEEQRRDKFKAERELKIFIQKQIEEKELMKKNEKKLKEEEQKSMSKIFEETAKNSMKKLNELKEIKNAYKHELDKQLEKKQELPSMSETERAINKKLLDRCQQHVV